jgi:protein-S-isoprenylcysteine O-methyltransferase Ste14
MRVVGSTELLVRAVALYLPVTAVVALALYVRPDRRRVAAALLATAWNLPALLAVNVVAVHVGWWRFASAGAGVAGVPIELWLGWALLWGAVPLLATVGRLLPLALALVAADLVVMPLAEPVLVLDGSWLVGEAVAVVVCLVPGLLLGRWTATDRRLGPRVALQVVAFTALTFYLLPSLVFTVTGEGWGHLLDRPRWQFVAAAVVLAPVGAMALQAVLEFAAHGGTPVPLDPPKVLVSTGPYAYVANPMQLAASVLLAAWSVLVSSPAVLAAAVMAVVFSAGLAAWNEDQELSARFGEGWHGYRRRVRTWLPHWRPVHVEPATVYVAGTCDPCREVGGFLADRPSVGLDVRPAEQCAVALQRVTYERDGRRADGVAAIGRSLEHVNLAWAVGSWIGRLPVVRPFLQLITDAVGGEPRAIPQPAVESARREAGG